MHVLDLDVFSVTCRFYLIYQATNMSDADSDEFDEDPAINIGVSKHSYCYYQERFCLHFFPNCRQLPSYVMGLLQFNRITKPSKVPT